MLLSASYGKNGLSAGSAADLLYVLDPSGGSLDFTVTARSPIVSVGAATEVIIFELSSGTLYVTRNYRALIL